MKLLQFGKHFTKIGLVDPEIIGLKGIIKMKKETKKLTQAEHIAGR